MSRSMTNALTLLVAASVATQTNKTTGFEFANACRSFSNNQVLFRDKFLNTTARIEATVSAVQDDGTVVWLVFFPRSAGSSSDNEISWDLMGSLYYARIPRSKRSQVASLEPGDRVEFTATLRSMRETFKDRIQISGSTVNGYGYTYGGTVTVRTLVWTFDYVSGIRTRSVKSLLKEKREAAALEQALRDREQQAQNAERLLLTAIAAGDVERARLLISQGVRYDVIGQKRVLQEAVRARAYRTTKLLLNLPLTNINASDGEGYTALALAKRIGDFSIIELLIDYGARDE